MVGLLLVNARFVNRRLFDCVDYLATRRRDARRWKAGINFGDLVYRSELWYGDSLILLSFIRMRG